MGWIMDFDYYKVGDDFEIVSWDSYFMGFFEDCVGVDVVY